MRCPLISTAGRLKRSTAAAANSSTAVYPAKSRFGCFFRIPSSIRARTTKIEAAPVCPLDAESGAPESGDAALKPSAIARGQASAAAWAAEEVARPAVGAATAVDDTMAKRPQSDATKSLKKARVTFRSLVTAR